MAVSENDILIENEDVQILNGDFDIVDCNQQNIRHIIIADVGSYAIAPKIGVGIYRMQNSPVNDIRGILGDITAQLKRDGYRKPVYSGESDLESTNLEVSADRISNPTRFLI